MWVLLKRAVTVLLFDEAAAQRFLAAGLALFTALIQSGGVVPGTNLVVPINNFTWLGPWLNALNFYLASGGRLPGRSNGNS